MFDIIQKYLRRVGIDYAVLQEGRALDFLVEAPEGRWNCLLSVYESTGIGIYSTVLESVPHELRTKMALFLTMLNNNRLLGNFEMDLRTGDVRFKTYLDCSLMELSERLLERSLLVNITTMQKYLNQILRIMVIEEDDEDEEGGYADEQEAAA